MKRTLAGRVIPGLLMTGAVAAPVATTVEMMSHAGTAAGSGLTLLNGKGSSSSTTAATNSGSSRGNSAPPSSGNSAPSPASGTGGDGFHHRHHDDGGYGDGGNAPGAAPSQATPTPQPAQPTPTPQAKQVASGGRHTYAGPAVDGFFGPVQATVTVKNRRITAVSISAPQDNPRSAWINQQAVPMLQQETLQAQSANINIISGATITSEAFAQSLQAALQQAGI